MRGGLDHAISLAAQVHLGQTDKAGEPYILHPLRVMLKMGPREEDRIVAVLHDVMEDSDPPITASELIEKGFSGTVAEAVAALTRKRGETYEQYIDRIETASILVRQVKIADLDDNTDYGITRKAIPNWGPKDSERHTKYCQAYNRLVYSLPDRVKP